MVSFTRASDFVLPHQSENVKTYSVYDGSNRLIQFYVAITTAKHGDQCMLTTYGYIGATPRVEKTSETLATWDSSWD